MAVRAGVSHGGRSEDTEASRRSAATAAVTEGLAFGGWHTHRHTHTHTRAPLFEQR